MIKKQLFVSLLAMPLLAQAQNPVIRDQFAADPTARVFNDKVYLYPSHDIFPPEGQRQDWFCMEDYHVFSSENLTDWTDHGVIVTQNKVPWVKPDSYSMWAPDCIERNGKYYFYFPSAPKDGRGFGIGGHQRHRSLRASGFRRQCLHFLGGRPLCQTQAQHEGTGRRHTDGDRQVGRPRV